MRARTLLVAAVLACSAFVLLVWLVFRARVGPEPVAAPAPGQKTAEPVHNKAPGEEPPIQTGGEEVPRARDAAPEAAEKQAETQEADEKATVKLEGTLVVLDAEENEHAEEDGELVLVLWAGNSGKNTPKIELKKGHWETELSAESRGTVRRLGVRDLVAGGQPALLDGDHVPLLDDGVIELRARWLNDLGLKVVGADTRADLADVTVVEIKDSQRDHFQHPGKFAEDEVVARGASSPVNVPVRRDGRGFSNSKRTLWAHAPGYAWDRILVDSSAGGERLLVLHRAADLEVTLVNYRPPPPGEASAVLRVREALPDRDKDRAMGKTELAEPQPGTPVAEAAPGESAIRRIDGLVPARYAVQLEVGEWFRSPLVLGKAWVDLKEGERAAVTIEVKERPRLGDPVPLEGTLYLPEAWGEVRLSLTLEPLNLPQSRKERAHIASNEMDAVPNRPGIFRWRAGKVPPGKYKAQVSPFNLQEVIDVGPDGPRDAEIKIGEPADVTVKLVDAETGEPLEAAAKLYWNCRRPDGVRTGGVNSAEWSSETKVYHLRAPAGELELSALLDGYRWKHELVEARPGKTEATLRLEKGCGFIVTVEEGEKKLPYAFLDKKLHFREVEGSGTVTGWGRAGEAARLTLSNPGTYDITLDKLEGYAPVEPMRIEIHPGQYAEHVVRLQREQY